MPDFTVRSDSVNVEQIMDQIRSRIREKRGVDYTEQQIHELANVKLEKFLDPRSVRSDLLERFKSLQPKYEPPELPNYPFEDETLFDTHRGVLRFIRRLLQPILKLFFNPNPLIHALHTQSRLNAMYAEREARREAMRLAGEQIYYELMHNLVVETTRTGIEVKNLKMRIESLSSRLEFNERRARGLESAVVYKQRDDEGDRNQRRQTSTPPQPQAMPSAAPPNIGPAAVASAADSPAAATGMPAEGPGQRSRRRRRRRGRRNGAPPAAVTMGGGGTIAPGGAQTQSEPPADSPASPREDLETFGGAQSHRSEPQETAPPRPESVANPSTDSDDGQ
jgi:hypothetical protein